MFLPEWGRRLLSIRFSFKPGVLASTAPCYDTYLQDAAEKIELKMSANDCPKEKLENFELLGCLGKGFSGAVYKARHKGRFNCAIKVLPKASFTERTAKSHGLLEKKIQHAIDSPFIVKIYFAFQDTHNLYLAMQYGAYGDLKHIFETITEFATERLIKLFAAQMVLALEYLHACGYAHYDLKLTNILLFEDGYLKLCDLGFVKKVDADIFFYYGQDWWDLGRTLATLVLGTSPKLKITDDATDTYFDVLHLAPRFPRFTLSEEVKDFLAQLLRRDRERQLGGGANGAREVKTHRWFEDIDFLEVFHKKLPMKSMIPHDLRFKSVRSSVEIPRSPELVPDQTWFEGF